MYLCQEYGLKEFVFLTILVMVALLYGCKKVSGDSKIANATELKKYKTVVSYEEGILSNPQIIRYHEGNSHLFVYDAGKRQVLELNSRGNKVNEYGHQGRGPGEFSQVNNIFLANGCLYVVDRIQFRISKFAINGELEGTFNYGEGSPQALPPPAPQAGFPRAKNIANQPFVTQKGNLLLSNIKPKGTFNKLYKLVNWKGNYISEIGDIPEGSAFTLDYDKYQATVGNQEIPAFYKPKAFPVSDYANREEFYFIYRAYPKIVKYNMSGEKRWETDISKTPELDSIITHFYEVSGQMSGRSRIGLNTYVSGASSPEGSLYLSLGKNTFWDSSNRLWIHKFNSKGELSRRFKLISEDVSLASIFDIDFKGRRIFVVTKEGEIRAYSF